MCLATLGQIKKIYNKNGLKIGEIDFEGIIKEIHLNYTADAKIGDYITAHENLAIKKFSENEAKEIFEMLKNSCEHHSHHKI